MYHGEQLKRVLIRKRFESTFALASLHPTKTSTQIEIGRHLKKVQRVEAMHFVEGVELKT